jgi:hypothetical protein
VPVLTPYEISRLHGELTSLRLSVQMLKAECAPAEVIRLYEMRSLQTAMQLKAAVEGSLQ